MSDSEEVPNDADGASCPLRCSTDFRFEFLREQCVTRYENILRMVENLWLFFAVAILYIQADLPHWALLLLAGVSISRLFVGWFASPPKGP